MKREIKFRAWGGEVMFIVSDIEWCACEPIKPVSIDGFTMKNGIARGVTWFEGDKINMILMQFTGLKDKNGKEIYAGDVVRGFMPSHGIEETVVIYERGCFLLESSRWPVYYWTMPDSYIEVIGNIYEDPELRK